MLSVILSIMKIIGIILLAAIGILLALILTVLFIPVRYRIYAEHGKSFEINAVVSWFFHIVHARFLREKNVNRLLVRVIGIPVYDSLRHSARNDKKGRDGEPLNTSKVTSGEDKKTGCQNTECPGTEEKNTGTKDTESKIEVNKVAVNKDNKYMVNKDNKYTEKDNDLFKTESGYGKPLKDTDTDMKDSEENAANDKDFKDAKANESKKGRLIRLFGKIKKIKSGIRDFIKNIVNKIRNLIRSLSNIRRKLNLILDFLRNEANKEGFRFTYECILKLLKHIKPTKLKSRLVFGTGDPCSTGQILGLFGILYGFYGNDLNITPDFENKVFEGTHYARGRIRLFTVLIIVGGFLLDKRFKQLKMNYQLLKEAL